MQWPWRKADIDLDREVQYHLESLADAFQREGLTRSAAMRRARAEFGGVDRTKEECRDESRWNWLAQCAQDVRFGWRMIRKTPVISMAAVVSLALGIGATTAILSLADAVLWRTIGAPAPEQLRELMWYSSARPDGLLGGSSGSSFREGGVQVADFFSKPTYDLMRQRAAGKAEVAGHIGSSQVSASFDGTVVVAQLRGVTGNFFPMLQLQPAFGRLLTGQDDDPAAAPAVVVTRRFLDRHLGGNPAIAGQSIHINNTVYTISGVLPASFPGIVAGDETDIYAPIQQSPDYLMAESWYRESATDPLRWWMQLIVRKEPGTNDTELRTLLNAAFAASWAAQPKSPQARPHIRISNASRGLGDVRRQFGNPVWILLGLVAMVLLVACANIASLLLARAVEQEKEVALRLSLGCGEARLIRQFFTGSLMLASIGGLFGVGVAMLLGRLMLTVMPRGMEGMTLLISPDARSLAGAAAVTLLTSVLFGLYPAWRAARLDPAPALKEGSGSGGTMSRGRWAPAKMLVVVQVSLGVILLTAAIIFTNHLNGIVTRDAGFERGHVLLFDVRPGELGYHEDRLRQFYIDLEERLSGLPGVEAVGLARTRPMRGGGYTDTVRTPGSSKSVNSWIHHATHAFPAALGVPIVAGRAMSRQELRTHANVAVISEDIVKEFGFTSPLGMRVQVENSDYEIIGVAKRARYSRLSESATVVYVPFDFRRQSATVIIRTAIPPMAVLGAVRRTVGDMDRNLPLVDVYTMEQQISRTLQRERLFAWLCGSFGALALVLCVVGLYGLMSHTTARRTPEIGIRIALGASRAVVLRQILAEGMSLAVAGFVLGIPLALYGAHVAISQKLLPEGPLPYWTIAASIGVLTFSALTAVYAPALQASSVDPMRALRRN